MEPAPFQRRDAVNRTVCLSLRDHKVLQYCSWVKGSVALVLLAAAPALSSLAACHLGPCPISTRILVELNS